MKLRKVPFHRTIYPLLFSSTWKKYYLDPLLLPIVAELKLDNMERRSPGSTIHPPPAGPIDRRVTNIFPHPCWLWTHTLGDDDDDHNAPCNLAGLKHEFSLALVHAFAQLLLASIHDNFHTLCTLLLLLLPPPLSFPASNPVWRPLTLGWGTYVCA